MVDRSNHIKLSESDRVLEDQEQDIRGWPVQDRAGNTLGTVSDLMLNTDTEIVDFAVLDDGDEYPVDDLRIGDGVVYLADAGALAADMADEDELTVQRTEEELRAGTREREIGDVRVRKRVETDRERIEVPKRREEAHVERVPINEETTGESQIGDEEVRVPLAEEEVVVEKRPVTKEEIRIRKNIVEDTEVVEGDVRKEEVDIDDESERRRDR